MDYIAKRFKVVTLDEMHDGEKSSLPKLVLSFDDGYKDFYDNALPILDRFGLPSISKYCGRKCRKWQQFLDSKTQPPIALHLR
jgi:hypothetical protein